MPAAPCHFTCHYAAALRHGYFLLLILRYCYAFVTYADAAAIIDAMMITPFPLLIYTVTPLFTPLADIYIMSYMLIIYAMIIIAYDIASRRHYCYVIRHTLLPADYA